MHGKEGSGSFLVGERGVLTRPCILTLNGGWDFYIEILQDMGFINAPLNDDLVVR